MCFDRCPRISIPTSCRTAIASGRTASGRVPALSTSKYSPASCRSSPSAIWLAAELPVQKISTLFFSVRGSGVINHSQQNARLKTLSVLNDRHIQPEQLLRIEEPAASRVLITAPLFCFLDRDSGGRETAVRLKNAFWPPPLAFHLPLISSQI